MRTSKAKASPPGAQAFGARFHAVAGQLRTAKCECGNPQKADCYRYTPDMDHWCWPCRVRWSLRPDAAKFIAPMDDVVRTKVVL